MGLSNGTVSVEDTIGSRRCPESLKIAKGTMFLSFLPVFASQNHCVPSHTGPRAVIPAGMGSRAAIYGPDSCLELFLAAIKQRELKSEHQKGLSLYFLR